MCGGGYMETSLVWAEISCLFIMNLDMPSSEKMCFL